MARRIPSRSPISRVGSAARAGRRAWPIVLMAWERWQSLSDEEKDRYRRQARDYAGRGRQALDRALAQQARGRKRR